MSTGFVLFLKTNRWGYGKASLGPLNLELLLSTAGSGHLDGFSWLEGWSSAREEHPWWRELFFYRFCLVARLGPAHHSPYLHVLGVLQHLPCFVSLLAWEEGRRSGAQHCLSLLHRLGCWKLDLMLSCGGCDGAEPSFLHRWGGGQILRRP